MAKKSAKKAAVKKPSAEKPAQDELIKPLSVVKAMSDKDQQAFRDSGGTTTQG